VPIISTDVQKYKHIHIFNELSKHRLISDMRAHAKEIASKLDVSPRYVYDQIKQHEALRKEVAKGLFRFFVVRIDTYAIQREDKSYTRVSEPLTPELIEKQHLEGLITIGTYNLNKENNVKWLCFDIDPQNIENSAEITKRIYGKCGELFPTKSILLEASRYNDPSFHVWVFFEPEIPAYAARFLGEKVLEKCGNPNVELFPKQDKIEEDGFGNLMKIPLGLHKQEKKWSCFLNPNTSEPLALESILELQGCTLLDHEISQIKDMTDRSKETFWFGHEAKETEAYKGEAPACINHILKGAKEGLRNESAIRLASFWLNFCKEAPEKVKTQLSEWNLRNKPPMEEKELETIFQSVLRGGYNYSCEDQILKNHCPKEGCKLRKKEPVEIRLAELRAELIDQPVRVKAQIVGESDKMVCCRRALIECLNCGTQKVLDLAEPRNYKVLQKRLRFGKDKFKRSLYSFHVCSCQKAKRKVSLEGSLDYRRLYCQDLIDPKEKWEERTYRTVEAILVGDPKEAVMKKIELNGIVTTLKRDKISIMVYKVEPIDKPVPSSMEGFEQYFRSNEKLIEDLDGTIQTYIRGRPTEKLLVALVLHSPYELVFEGERIRGNLNALQLGETKTGKSDLLEWVEANVAGEVVRGETAKRTGLGFSVDTEAKVIFWGALPRGDKEVCMIDGLDRFDLEDLTQLREAMSKQRLKVSMAVSGEALCRTRIIASANPRERAFDKYITMAESIRGFFNDPTLVTRWDLFVPFRRTDVSAEEIAEAKSMPSKIPLDVFRNHVFWAWSLEPDGVQFAEEAQTEIKRLFIEMQDYTSNSLPLVHSEWKRTLARISAAYAVLTHNVDKKGRVHVTKDHVSKAQEILWNLLEAWEYNLYVARERKTLEIAEDEWTGLLDFLTGDIWKIFSSIADEKGIERAVLITRLDKSAPTIDRYLSGLKERNLVEHAKGRKGGYQLTERGIAVYRKMIKMIAEKGDQQKIKLPSKEEVLAIKTLEEPEQGKCSFCGNDRVLYYQVEGFKREWGLACQDCGEAIKQQF
jgi:DNA replicative helicase MCM subunit Mcm2 (Cdc46/Mcm family)/predicted transcriptional regulator